MHLNLIRNKFILFGWKHLVLKLLSLFLNHAGFKTLDLVATQKTELKAQHCSLQNE